jgi:NAD(P)-dependent dehydrogenase (short-subunit alcohol dehydrogenase family)
MKFQNLVATVLCGVLFGAALPLFAAENLAQKAVLVTGASSGIGLRIAETLASHGYYVYAGARKTADLKRLDALENISSVQLDVTRQADIDAAVEFVRDQGRGLWGVVNNAGIVALAPLAGDSLDEIRFTFEVNVFGPMRINQAFLPLLIESQGRTTTIGSISGYIADSEDGGYSSSKFAIEGYIDSLAIELKDSGVHVSVVSPGGYKSQIRAKMLDQMLAAAGAGAIELSEQQRDELVRTEMGNSALKEPDEVADVVLELMSSSAPRQRYMVVPNAKEAALTMQASMRRLLQLNQGQPYSYNREQLIELIDQLLSGQ